MASHLMQGHTHTNAKNYLVVMLVPRPLAFINNSFHQTLYFSRRQEFATWMIQLWRHPRCQLLSFYIGKHWLADCATTVLVGTWIYSNTKLFVFKRAAQNSKLTFNTLFGFIFSAIRDSEGKWYFHDVFVGYIGHVMYLNFGNVLAIIITGAA